MKIHVYGNTLNSAFHLTKALRDRGLNAEMFLDHSTNFDQDFPWWDDKNLSPDNLPDWIHYYREFPNYAFPSNVIKGMIHEFSKCDIALVSCYGPILAMKANVPYVFHALGSDLNMVSYSDELKSLIFNSYTLKAKLKKLIKILFFVPSQKKSLIQKASRIIFYMGYQYNPYIIPAGLAHKTIRLTYPKDILNYATEEDTKMYEHYKRFKTLFVMISRQSWKSKWNDPKGNNKFIVAFAKFVKEYKPDARLIMFKKGIDFERSMNLVTKLGIDEYVEWKEQLPKYELKKITSLRNTIVVDNFWHDQWFKRYPQDKLKPKVGFGFGSIEALASRRPLITAFEDQEFYDGNTPPILRAFTIEEIYNQLVKAYSLTDAEKIKIGEEGYNFVLEWHEQTKIIQKFEAILQEVYKEVNESTKNNRKNS